MKIAGIENLTTLIKSVVSPFPDRLLLNELVKICYRISYTHLCYKIEKGRLKLSRIGLSLGDFAWDCIGDLFKQNNEGVFSNFRNLDIDSEKDNDDYDEIIFIKLKNLVISSVNDHLFRLYRESDTDLGRLIRNIKLHVNKMDSLKLEKKNGETVLYTETTGSNDHNRIQLPKDMFYSELLTRIKGKSSLKSILNEIPAVFSQLDKYQNSFSVTSTALVIRQIFVKDNMLDEIADIELPSLPERENLIQQAIDRVGNAYGKKYITANKLDACTMAKYFAAIKQVLFGNFVDGDGTNNSYYNIFSKFFPGINKECYLANHRSKFEYLAKLVRDEFIELIKIEL